MDSKRKNFERDLSLMIDGAVLDDQGCINGDYCEGLVDEPDFIDLLTDDRYAMEDEW